MLDWCTYREPMQNDIEIKIEKQVRLGVHVSIAKCLMGNSDSIARTSYGKYNGENTITSIERFTQVYKENE